MQGNVAHAMETNIKCICYRDANAETEMTVSIKEVLDPAYGCYIWPSALVMGDYVWYHRRHFAEKTVLEVGAGTSLPSLVLAKYDHPPRLILSDIPSILSVVHSCLSLNNLNVNDTNLWVRALEWGPPDPTSDRDVSSLVQAVEKSWKTPIDYVLGSDTFYDPAEFENLLVVISYLIHRHNRNCKFITAYQERSAKRSIQFLLDKWSLQCKLIPRESFHFDESRFLSKNENTPHNIVVNAGTLASVFMLEISAKQQL